ncbi:MAG: GNAT family protein [Bacillota bacterium]|nr:GNAT family protein [Bacillota bacterium]
MQLIPMETIHIDGLWEAAKPDEIWSFMATKVRNQEELESMLTKAIHNRDQGLEYPFVVMDKSNKIIGSTRFLDIYPQNNSLEIGWTWYHPSVWRSSVNTECKFLLLEHAFEKWDINRVQLKTDSRNIRSQNAITRIGAVKEGTLRKDRVISDGYTRDTVFYSILKEEWPLVKEKLRQKLAE